MRKQHFLKLAIQTLVRNGGVATIQADYMRRLLAALKMDAEFTILPGSTTVYMKEDVSPAQGVNVLSFKTGLGWNLDRLEDVEAVLKDTMRGKLYGGLDEAIASLEKIGRRPNLYGPWIEPLAWSVIGCVVTMMLGARYIEGLVALVTGLIFGLSLVLLNYAPVLGFTFEFWVSFVVALLLGLTQAFIIKDLVFWPPFLASVILILPGFSMSMGFLDVFSRNTAYGLTTLFNAAWAALSIGIGAFAGFGAASRIAMRELVPLRPSAATDPSYSYWLHVALYPVFSVLLNLSFQAKPLQAVIIAPIAVIPYALFLLMLGVGGMPFPVTGLADEIKIFSCILFMGLLGFIYGRVAKTSELPTTISGIIVFAPGTYGARAAYYGMQAIFSDNAEAAIYAVKQATGMLSISASIALGLLASRAIFGRL